MAKKQFHIAELIAHFLSNTITPEEQIELQQWRDASPENEELFKRICDTENFARHYEESKRFDKQVGWEHLNRRMRFLKRRSLVIKLSRYAAVLLLPLAVGVLLMTTFTPFEETVAEQMQKQTVQILPGEKRAVLTLDSGEVVDLKTTSGKTMTEKDGTAITVDSTALNYQQTQAQVKSEKEIYNKVEIPRGGEYSLTLSDGTKVYLNAMSSLSFPVRFLANKRVVELTGEAYFEVAKNNTPFIVKMKNMEVEVLGTAFNISAYAGEDCQTTLVNGSVKVQMETGSSCILKPSEQAYVKPGTDNLNVRTVDTSIYTSWIDGKIYFRDERLEDIMNTLSRWYDMQVFYSEPSVKNLRFGCNVNRYKDITPFLELLEKTEKVDIMIDGKNITFKHNN
ncbi:FecR family protein [Bacteroides sp. 51]|uniref:FecR family protein n=1 Tax=Bacteroides sp. 51 TaxID=2302938 RepID=UPI0013D6C2A7|nr:FecR family protein [Bacteroides sp. 51]NDV83480.1 DUF4974 domain-containing protein [Bacteroides sp. 51]